MSGGAGMHAEIERYRELGALIRHAQAELGAKQICLVEAHQRNLDPAELGVHIANLGRQIARWKHEQIGLFRRIVGEEEAPLLSAADCSRLLNQLRAGKFVKVFAADRHEIEIADPKTA